MATVTEIETKRGRTEIWLDGALFLRVPERDFKKLPLTVDEEIEPAEYIDRLASRQLSACYEAALTLLDSAAQTSDGMRRALMRRGYVEPAAQATTQKLCEVGLIDDRRYAERVAQAQLSKSVGAYAVRRKLRAKHLSEDDIEEAMSGFDEDQQKAACREAAKGLVRKYASLPSREARAKLSQALARRGFSWDAIGGAVDDAFGDGDE